MRTIDFPFQAIDTLTFSPKPQPLPASLRPIYRIALIILVLKTNCHGNTASLLKLQFFNWLLKSSSLQELIEDRLTRQSVFTGLVSNGTLLSSAISQALIQSGLDKLWISLDNIHQDSILEGQGTYTRQNVLNNLEGFLDLSHDQQVGPAVGLVFVLTKSNSSQVQYVFDLGKSLGVKSFFFTNLEALSEEMAGEIPYRADQFRHPGSWLSAQSNLIKELQGADDSIIIEGSLGNPATRCPFAEKGEIALRWDGEASPCLPLLYDHASFIYSWKHQIDSYSIGNIQTRSIQEIWTDQEFEALRERLLGENFSPCLSCRDCWLSEDNRLDCMGYEHPTCGGCLWAHGFVGCP